MKTIALALISIILVINLTSCITIQRDVNNESSELVQESTNEVIDITISYGDTFEFDELEITFYDSMEWGAISNQYSDNDGAEYFTVEMTVKNISSETHGLNMFHYTQYGSNGTKLDKISAHVDDVAFAGDMRSGAELSTCMAFLYDGDGSYWVEFSVPFGEKIEVEIPIKK